LGGKPMAIEATLVQRDVSSIDIWDREVVAMMVAVAALTRPKTKA
jgi:hypothetical protein